MKRVLLSWSSGKDCAWALHLLRQQADIEVVALVTTLNSQFQRVAMHGTRLSVLEAQAAAAQLPLWIVPLPWPCTNEIYEQRMAEVCGRALKENIDAFAFGDLFLTDLRAWRETNLAKAGMRGIFPIWKRDTTAIAHEVIRLGYKAYLSCVEGNVAPKLVGRLYDEELLRELPLEIDPCGENGEFHSFVFDGPIFKRPVLLKVGEIVMRDGRYYADLLPKESELPEKCVGELIPPV